MGSKPYHERETLENLYVIQDLTQTEIAEKFGVDQQTISNWLRKTEVITDEPTPWQHKETLRWLYCERGYDQQEIADLFGVAPNTVSTWMSRHDITTRPHQDAPHKNETVLRYLYEEEQLSTLALAERFGKSRETIRYWMNKHGIERRSSNHEQYQIPKERLKELYVDEKQSAVEIAEKYGVSAATVTNRLEKHKIKQRNNSQRQRVWHGEFVPLRLDALGYPRWRDQIAGKEISVHRLTAIAHGADPHKIFGEYHVHHKNAVRWDNRPSNLEMLLEDTHMATHQNDEWTDRDGYPELKTVEPKYRT